MTKRLTDRCLLAAALPACLWLAGSLAYGGSGQFDNGDYNFCVSVRFNASAAELAQVRTAFQNGSQILADATDGQQRFGTVTIVNDSGASQSSEYWVNSGGGRAYATLGEYGVRGQHVMLYFDDNFQADNGADGDAYTVAHEHAHHTFGVADEYSGPGGNAECAAPPDTATMSFCLMDNYFTRGGRVFGAGYTLNEFCTAGNHDPDADTHQENINGESCWETISSHPSRSATAPAALPVDAAPAAHNVTFRDGFGGLRVMLVLDRSGSMSIQQRLEFAKLGGNTFINFLGDGDAVGVASFSSSASVNFPLTTITGATTRTSAKAAVNSLFASGSTNVGGGLLAGLGQITGQAQRSCNEIIVLLSDGDHNTGTPPSAVIPQLRQEGVTALTVGVGSGLSTSGQATLQSIATQTGGRFFRVANSFDLLGLFLRLVFESTGAGLLTRAPTSIQNGEVQEFQVQVEAGVDRATFTATYPNSSDDLILTLETPSGGVITEAVASTNPDITFIREPNAISYQVVGPEAGEWTMVLAAVAVTTGVVELQAFAEHPGVSLNMSVAKNELTYPEAVEIHATPTFGGEAVVGASVTGIAQRPDGSSVPFDLHDDGDPANGDAVANDGIYSARFANYSEDGTYTFEVMVDSFMGQTFGGEELFAFLPPNVKPVPPFIRLASATAVVTGIPEFIVGTVEYGPETINLRSRGRFVTAYIELPAGFVPGDIEVSSVALTAVDGQPIAPIPALAQPVSEGDFDTDGIPDLMVKFHRGMVQDAVTPGMRTIRLEGMAAGQMFVAERSVGVIMPGLGRDTRSRPWRSFDGREDRSIRDDAPLRRERTRNQR